MKEPTTSKRLATIEGILINVQSQLTDLQGHVQASNGRLATVERWMWTAIGGVTILAVLLVAGVVNIG